MNAPNESLCLRKDSRDGVRCEARRRPRRGYPPSSATEQHPTLKPKKINSTSSTWALYALTGHPAYRAEPFTTMDDTYFDCVVCETLRLYALVPNVFMEATNDEIIPLSRPLVDKRGFSDVILPFSFGLAFLVVDVAVNSLMSM
jgi:hypothetical protein